MRVFSEHVSMRDEIVALKSCTVSLEKITLKEYFLSPPKWEDLVNTQTIQFLDYAFARVRVQLKLNKDPRSPWVVQQQISFVLIETSLKTGTGE